MLIDGLFKYDCLACTDNGTDANVDIPAQACHHACNCGLGTRCSPVWSMMASCATTRILDGWCAALVKEPTSNGVQPTYSQQQNKTGRPIIFSYLFFFSTYKTCALSSSMLRQIELLRSILWSLSFQSHPPQEICNTSTRCSPFKVAGKGRGVSTRIAHVSMVRSFWC